MTRLPSDLAAARDQWRWRGDSRPPFATNPGPGQSSVWDFPRPPRLEPDSREVVICWGGLEVARTTNAVRVLETSHPPSYYLPLQDIAQQLLQPAPGSSFCEWKGPARYWSLVDKDRRLDGVAWSYPTPLAGAEPLASRLAFYPAQLQCTVDGRPVSPQPGGFYGGWVTPELVGPFKGEPGTSSW